MSAGSTISGGYEKKRHITNKGTLSFNGLGDGGGIYIVAGSFVNDGNYGKKTSKVTIPVHELHQGTVEVMCSILLNFAECFKI